MPWRRFLLALFLAHRIASAATLPQLLNPSEISKIVDVIGAASSTKLLRSAEPYPFFFPGMKIGLEINMLSADEIYRMGNMLGSGPGIIPLPRFYLSKGLFANVEVIASFLPNAISSPVNTWGLIGKYSFVTEEDNSFSAALFAGLTWVRGFNAIYEGTDYETGILLSKDYVKLRPYIGAAALVASGKVAQSHALTTETGATRFLFHPFLGAELLLPLTISFQIDLYNDSPKASVFLGKEL